MAFFDLYGSASLLHDAKEALEHSLGVSFDEHESSYQGGIYYVWGDSAAEHFVLKKNVDPFDGEAVEQNFSNYPTLLYIHETHRALELGEVMKKCEANFSLLRREEL